MLNEFWPPSGLKISTGRLELRIPNDAEIALIGGVAAEGVHLPGETPFLTPWTDLPPRERALYVMQGHWSRLGSWRADDWNLGLGVFVDGNPAGMVTISASNFNELREVKAGSWLGLPFQRQGIGTEARKALLTLAFEHLGAQTALTEVFQDNLGSQGVSRKLGYRFDGTTRDVLHGNLAVSDRLRLDVGQWRAEFGANVAITGLAAAMPFFVTEAPVTNQ